MVFEINWTDKSAITYGKNIDYLREAWSETEVKSFQEEVARRLEVLVTQPYLGVARNEKKIYTRQIVINKRVLLIYQIKPLKQRIDLLRFWNTYQNPKRLKAI
jgi:plasmid stabilization system protein ParE